MAKGKRGGPKNGPNGNGSVDVRTLGDNLFDKWAVDKVNGEDADARLQKAIDGITDSTATAVHNYVSARIRKDGRYY